MDFAGWRAVHVLFTRGAIAPAYARHMTFYVSRITGLVDVFPDALAVDDNGDSLRFRSFRGETSAEVAALPKSTIVGLTSTIASDSEVIVVDSESPFGGRCGWVVSLRDPLAIEVDLKGDGIYEFAADQLGVWTENRCGHPGYPPRYGDAGGEHAE
jgi:hypothetical protein